MRRRIQAMLHSAGFKVSSLTLRNDLWHLVSHLIAQKRLNTVLDIGANEGQFLKKFQENVASKPDHVLSFEPIPGSFDKLVANQRSAASGLGWRAFPMALGNVTGPSKLNLAPNSVSTSLLQPAKDFADYMGGASGFQEIQVEVMRFEDFANQMAQSEQTLYAALSAPLFAKLDVQGFELKVLEGFGPYLDNLQAVVLECSFVESYTGRPLFHEIDAFMKDHGFHLSGLFPGFFDEEALRLLEVDAVYSRNP